MTLTGVLVLVVCASVCADELINEGLPILRNDYRTKWRSSDISETPPEKETLTTTTVESLQSRDETTTKSDNVVLGFIDPSRQSEKRLITTCTASTPLGNQEGFCELGILCRLKNGHLHRESTNSYCTGFYGCCIVTKTCGNTAPDEVFRYQSKSFPEFDTGRDICGLYIQPLPGACAIRLDFETFETSPQNEFGECHQDSMYFVGHPAREMQPLCGRLDGYSITLPVDPQDGEIYLSHTLQSTKYKWNIKVRQIKDCKREFRQNASCGMLNAESSKGKKRQRKEQELDDEIVTLEEYTRDRSYGLWPNDVARRHYIRSMKFELLGNPDYMRNSKIRPRKSLSTLPVDSDEYPWLAGIILLPRKQYICGGVLLTEHHVLTSANCIMGLEVKKLLVNLMEHDLATTTEKTSILMPVENIIYHWGYRESNSVDHNVGVVKMKWNVAFFNKLSPICLPLSDLNSNEEEMFVIGYGRSGVRLRKMRDYPGKSMVKLVNTIKCQEEWSNSRSSLVIGEHNFCTRTETELDDPCPGDFGSGLIRKGANGRYEVVGLFNYASPSSCMGSNRLPQVYTRVHSYLNWIVMNIS